MLRRVELASGLAASGFGILGWAYAVFGPTYHYMGAAISSDGKATTVRGATTLAQKGLEPVGMISLAVVLLVLVGIAAGAYWHSRRGVTTALTLLCTLTSLVWISVVLGAASVGVLLLPAALLALVTAMAGSLAQPRRGTSGE